MLGQFQLDQDTAVDPVVPVHNAVDAYPEGKFVV